MSLNFSLILFLAPEKLPVKEDTGNQITCLSSGQFWQKGGDRNSRYHLFILYLELTSSLLSPKF